MAEFFAKAIIVSGGVGLTGYFGVTLFNYVYHWMEQMAILLALPVGFWVAGNIALFSWLEKRENPKLRLLGNALGTVFTYTSLFQALFFCTIIGWVIGIIFDFGTLADTAEDFAFEFVFGSAYFSVFVYGATGLTMIFSCRKLWRRLYGAVYALATIAMPLYLLIWQKEALYQLAMDDTRSLVAATLGYYLLASVLGMAIMVQKEPLPEGKADGLAQSNASPAAKRRGER